MTDRLIRRIRPEQAREGVLLLVLVGLLFLFSAQIPNYFEPRWINRLTMSFAINLTVVVGQVLVMLTRNIDLSVSSTIGLSAYVSGTLLANHNDLSPAIAIAVAVAIGLLLGAINGVIVAYCGVPAIITTLGTLALYRVFLVEFSNADTVTTAALPNWLNDVPRASVFSFAKYDLRLVVAVALAVVIVGQALLRYLPFGRRLFAIGSNPEAARVAGLPIRRDTFLAFTLCGGLAGLGGFLYLVRFGNITVEAGQGLELQVVAAAVVGGVSVIGGSGSMFGAALGVVLIEVLQQSLMRWAGMSEFVKDAILGLMILAAVAADTILLRRLRDRWIAVRRQDKAARRGDVVALERTE